MRLIITNYKFNLLTVINNTTTNVDTKSVLSRIERDDIYIHIYVTVKVWNPLMYIITR